MATSQTLAAAPARSGSLIQTLVRTDDDRTLTALRVVLGVVMLPHGAQKLLGWFGGYGFEGTMGFLTGGVGLPWIVALLVIVAEFFGSLALVFGFLGRLGAAGIASVMIGAVLTTHLPNGFFMNWSGQQAGEGFEYHLLALAIAAVILVRGSGAASVDRAGAELSREEREAGRDDRADAVQPETEGSTTMPSRDRVGDMVERVERGDLLGAFEEFYADDVVMQENASPPTVGKAANREREAAFVGSIVEIHESRAEKVVVDGDRVAINWKAVYTMGDGNRLRFDQVALQTWRGDQIVEERFFYDPSALAA